MCPLPTECHQYLTSENWDGHLLCLPTMPASPMTRSTSFRWDRCSPALWVKITVIHVRNGKCSPSAQQPIRPLAERGRWISRRMAASTSPTRDAPNLCKYQWLRWPRSVKNRPVSTPIHSISCTPVFAQPNGTTVRERGAWRHRAQKYSTDLSLSLLSPFVFAGTTQRIFSDAAMSDLFEFRRLTV